MPRYDMIKFLHELIRAIYNNASNKDLRLICENYLKPLSEEWATIKFIRDGIDGN